MEKKGGGVFGVEEFFNFILRPDVEGAFSFVGRFGRIGGAVGVLRGIELAVGAGHVAEDVIEDVAGGGGVEIFGGDLIGVEIGAGKLGLVVERFFKVREEPAIVGGVAVG